ncbi:DUF4450 domain-containing protein [Sphingomonas sp.]|uniref:DUF4450 domain-containing protein n=1 Tax=Sphingomonas sp. TaxID=28214 RepID=UPI002ED9F1B1
MRYRPVDGGFAITNGEERFNRPLYGGNTAFRVDGGDKPEFSVYLPGRGGNLRFAVETDGKIWWLHDAARIVTRYLPGELHYEIRDPRLGSASLRLEALAFRDTEGLIVRLKGDKLPAGTKLRWAFGGINGERGARDGDIGTERVPISQYFQPQPAFASGNRVETSDQGFRISAAAATIAGTTSEGSSTVGNADAWDNPAALFAPAGSADRPIATGTLMISEAPAYLALKVLSRANAANSDLAIYREVSERSTATVDTPRDVTAFAPADLATAFERARASFAALRAQVSIDTPDPWINAAMAATVIGGDATWDDQEQAIMHGAVAWRTKLLGWRGPYLLDALGWHDRAKANFRYWFGRQNVEPVPSTIPPADEDSNLARNEKALHSNGDMSRSHYDMNAVFIDALFRHLLWTGDRKLAEEAWPVIERHLAWERRLFRRTYGPEKLPLYEAYAQIWASDDIAYNGGGTSYASAYNLYHNRMAARLARMLGKDPAPYLKEADLIGRGMRRHLWMPESRSFAEYKDLLGRQMLHPSGGLWTFYHTVDSEVTTAREAWSMASGLEREVPRIPILGEDVPADAKYGMYATSDWMPYYWSVNNVVMGENLHTALGLWQARRPEAAFTLAKSSLLASMYMGISPGNVGSMNYLDVYRRESQRDFADAGGVTSRAIVEGLFGVRPDALSGVLEVAPGFPAAWDHAALRHPDIGVSFRRDGKTELWTVSQAAARFRTLKLRIPARYDRLAVEAGGRVIPWRADSDAIGAPAAIIDLPFGTSAQVTLRWTGAPITSSEGNGATLVKKRQGAFTWLSPSGAALAARVEPMLPKVAPTGISEPLDLSRAFNDRVTAIFAPGKYRSPRSTYTSLALPAQGLGAWAGHVKAAATIDDTGLRRVAAENGGRLVLPDGGWFALSSAPDKPNAAFVSQWDNYPREISVPVQGKAQALRLLMAGTTNPMQSRIDNGEVIVTYADGGQARLPLYNPTTWWPIERDYLVDDFQFRSPGPPPLRVDLKSGKVRVAALRSRVPSEIDGGAATVLTLILDPKRPLRSVTIRALANEVVIGTLAATLVR